jgi:glycosyltransferase involved in cell wall biosynthesis
VRILHVCPYMDPSAGGPPIVVEKLCAFSAVEGCEATLITTSLYCEDDGSELQNLLRQRIHVDVLPIRGPRLLKWTPRAAVAIESAVERAHLVHLHTLWHPLNRIARRACSRFGRRYVVMPHGMLDPYSLNQKRWRKSAYLFTCERYVLEGACRLIFTAQQEAEAARARLSWLARDEVIPLAADCPSSQSQEGARGAFATLFPQASDRRCLLFLGRIDPKKGLERLLTALPKVIEEHPRVLLIVAGSGDPHYVRSIRERITSARLQSHVLLTGMLVGAMKWAAFASAEVFILPSKQENFAIAMAEAMHMGVPVVITNKVASWPLVDQANAGVIIDDNAVQSSLAPKLVELLANPAAARCMGRSGQDFARRYLTWSRVAKDMVSMYQRILSE